MASKVAITQLPKNSAELRQQWLQDVSLAAIETGVESPPVEPGSDWYLQGEADSQIAFIGIQNIALAAEAASVLDAVGDDLERHREALQIPAVEQTGSSGKIIVTVSGTATIPNNSELKLANGKRIKVTSTYINPANRAELDVTAIDVGTDTNAAGGAEVTFVSPPTNVAAKATVSYEFPLVGGTNEEDDERKRARILNVLKNKPGGGNWAEVRQVVLDNHGFVQDCYVFPAPGGPASQLAVPVRSFDIENNDYSRAPSSALLQAIRNTIQSKTNGGVEAVVRAAEEEDADFAIQIEIPESSLAGGNGQGWTDPAPWPSLEVADGGNVTVTGVGTNNEQITVDAQTGAPVDGQTHIAWWSPADRKFYTALVVTSSGSAGARVLNLDRPLVGRDGVGPASGDYICPAAQNLSAYGATWVSIFNELGPGEVTADSNRLPRSKRHPYTTDEDPAGLTNAVLMRVVQKHPEVTDIEFSYSPTTTPTVPATVDDPPAILVPRHLAFYPV